MDIIDSKIKIGSVVVLTAESYTDLEKRESNTDKARWKYLSGDMTVINLDDRDVWFRFPHEVWLFSLPIEALVVKSTKAISTSSDCSCTGRDLFLFGHKCGRKAKIDK